MDESKEITNNKTFKLVTSILALGCILYLAFHYARPTISTSAIKVQNHPEPIAATIKVELQPEMIVVPVSGQFLVACQTKEKLEELIGHSVARENTKSEAMFNNFDCAQIPTTEIYKILSVYDHMVEVVNVNAKLITLEGMWAVEEAFAPAK